MPIDAGDKVHTVERRAFDNDLRRHFVGEVTGMGESFMTVRGWVFVFDTGSATYKRHPEQRVRVISLVDSRLIINIIPENVEVENVRYTTSEDGGLRVTDEAEFSLSVNEFGFNR